MPHNDATKRIFSADAIRTKELIGVDIGFSSVSGESVTAESGIFDNLYVGGVKHIPKINFLYAFRFGGDLTKVPSKLPKMDGVDFYTGLVASDNKVFVDNTGIFNVGDHIIINPYGISGSSVITQEEATIYSIYDFPPLGCCNTKTLSFSQGGGNSVTFDYTRLDLEVGDKINISGRTENYTVTYASKDAEPSIIGYAALSPNLIADVNVNTCICLIKPVLQIDRGLYNSYPANTVIANKFGYTTEINSGIGETDCHSICYNANHLYLEIGSGLQYNNEEGMTWLATGYRENFIGYSGIDVHITGMDIYGLLTLIYPKE